MWLCVCILCGGLVPIDRYTQPHTTQKFINQKSKLTCNSADTDELPEDGTQLPKHAEAAK
jgi:hypothetical protein